MGGSRLAGISLSRPIDPTQIFRFYLWSLSCFSSFTFLITKDNHVTETSGIVVFMASRRFINLFICCARLSFFLHSLLSFCTFPSSGTTGTHDRHWRFKYTYWKCLFVQVLCSSSFLPSFLSLFFFFPHGTEFSEIHTFFTERLEGCICFRRKVGGENKHYLTFCVEKRMHAR